MVTYQRNLKAVGHNGSADWPTAPPTFSLQREASLLLPKVGLGCSGSCNSSEAPLLAPSINMRGEGVRIGRTTKCKLMLIPLV